MSLYDELICDYPLPDGWSPPPPGIFQTQDTPAQYLGQYCLTAEGTLMDATGSAVPFHGALTFYASNVCGVGPHGVVAHDHAPPWWAEYTALFDHGVLLKIEGAQHPWLWPDPPRPEQLTRAERD